MRNLVIHESWDLEHVVRW